MKYDSVILVILSLSTIFTTLTSSAGSGSPFSRHRTRFWRNKIVEFHPVQPPPPNLARFRPQGFRTYHIRRGPRPKKNSAFPRQGPKITRFRKLTSHSFGWEGLPAWHEPAYPSKRKPVSSTTEKPMSVSCEVEDLSCEQNTDLEDMPQSTGRPVEPKPKPFALHRKILQIGMPIIVGLMAWYATLMMMVTRSHSESSGSSAPLSLTCQSSSSPEPDLKSSEIQSSPDRQKVNIHMEMPAAGDSDGKTEEEREKDKKHEKLLKSLDVTDQVMSIVERGLLLAIRKVELLNVVSSLASGFSGAIPGGSGGGGGQPSYAINSLQKAPSLPSKIKINGTQAGGNGTDPNSNILALNELLVDLAELGNLSSDAQQILRTSLDLIPNRTNGTTGSNIEATLIPSNSSITSATDASTSSGVTTTTSNSTDNLMMGIEYKLKPTANTTKSLDFQMHRHGLKRWNSYHQRPRPLPAKAYKYRKLNGR